MHIGLVDVDSHNYPNLALMKISAYHKKRGDHVEFATMFDNYDILYKSKIFTFTEDDDYCYRANKIVTGGTGYSNFDSIVPDELITPDYSLYNCEHAYGFLTRGCNNNCSWCIVPQKEGPIRPNSDIDDIVDNFKSVVLMDNNILGHAHGIVQIEKIARLGIKVDFNQGLDARLIDNSVAKLLAKVKFLRPLRMACDTLSQIRSIEKATAVLRKHNVTPQRYFIYMLVKDIEDALERAQVCKKLNLDPFAQAYIDYSGKINISLEQKRFCRWVNHKAIFKSITWYEYK